jgi:peptidoglycan/LPS O-acetylase OafA/YrhL
MSKQIYNFQLIRATACLLVCISHIFITQKQNVALYANYIGIGQFGVGMFFFISGYLIMNSLERSNPKSFAIHRIFRIYPVLIFVSLIMLLIYKFYGFSTRCGDYGRSTSLAQLFLVSDLFGKCPLLAVQWTLFIELKFYIIAAVAFYFSKGNINKFLTLFYGLLLVIYILFLSLGKHLLAANTGGGIMFISLGVLFYLKQKNHINFERWAWTNIFVIQCGIFMFFDLGQLDSRLMSAIAFIAAYFFCLFLLKQNLQPRKIINFFADISFPLYLIHAFTSLDNFSMIERIIIFLAMIGFAWLIHIVIEKPGMEFGKSLI